MLKLQHALEGLLDGQDLAQMRGLEETSVEFIYALASLHFSRGLYKKAEAEFRFLCLHKHKEADFWLALARTRRMQGNLRGAHAAYLMALMIRPQVSLCLEMGRLYLLLGETERLQECVEGARRLLALGEGLHLAKEVEHLAGALGHE